MPLRPLQLVCQDADEGAPDTLRGEAGHGEEAHAALGDAGGQEVHHQEALGPLDLSARTELHRLCPHPPPASCFSCGPSVALLGDLWPTGSV